jgi:hypothetical protein
MFASKDIFLKSSGGAYQISRSVRLRSSATAYFNRTMALQSTRTLSMWIKRGALTVSGTDYNGLFFDPVGGFTCVIGQAGSAYADKLRLTNSNGSVVLYSAGVLRDPSAWYHVMFVQAASTAFIYINGVLSNSTASTGLAISSGTFTISYTNSANCFDGYMTEVNLIDGQALTPSSFGETNAVTGVWQPKKFSGTYGTNGFYLPFNVGTSSYAGIFNGSSKSLSGTLASAVGSGNLTIEAWVNQSTLTNFQDWFSITRGAGGFNIGTDASGTLVWYSGGARQIAVSGVVKTGQWQHVAFVRSGTTVTAYLNGISQGTATVSTNFSSTGFFIGSLDNTQEWANGAISNLRLTNTAVYTSNFVPSTSPLTAVTGTILLTLQNSTFIDNSGNSTSISNTGTTTSQEAYPFVLNIAADFSPNGNNWTPNNISLTAGVTYDSMLDVPTPYADGGNGRGNYCVLNPLVYLTSGSIANGNLRLNYLATASSLASTGVTSGKWYFETTITTQSTGQIVGLSTTNFAQPTQPVGADVYSWGLIVDSGANSGKGYHNGATTSSYTTFTSSDVVMVAFDIDAGKIWWGKNNVWLNSGVPSSGTGAIYTNLSGIIYPSFWNSVSGGILDHNFGQRPFIYTPPTGFVALNTQNLPAPTISNGASYMAATTYTGTGSALTIANTVGSASFQPDLVWVKGRSGATDHAWYDAVRGVQKQLESNNTAAETTETTGLTAFGSTGFTVGALAQMNTSAATYVAWQWNAGGSTVTNTSGTISAQVRANPTAGFSVVTYTGNSTSGATIGHGLGVKPDFMIFKYRGSTIPELPSWYVYHKSYGATQYMYLNSTAALDSSSVFLNNTEPTSTLITLGNAYATNDTSETYVAYCFAAVVGYSAFGSYTGNGSTDGPFVFTGFRPRFILIKESTPNARGWRIFDTSRNTYNQAGLTLSPNSSDAEDSGSGLYNQMDILSNGFKLRAGTNSEPTNESGATYIYACFAENPFKLSLAR